MPKKTGGSTATTKTTTPTATQPYIGGTTPMGPVSSSPTTWKNATSSTGNPYTWYNDAYKDNTQPPFDWASFLGSLGGGGSGGGSGGGGTPLTGPYASAMLGIIGRKPNELSYKDLSLPAYQPYKMPEFDASMYDRMRADTAKAAAADKSTANMAYSNLSNQLASNYQNAYANASYATTPQMQAAMSNMLGARGNGAVQQQIGAENAYSQNADAAFGNVLALLSANQDMSQQSRMNQVGMDRNTALRGIDASVLGINAGINRQQGDAKSAYDRESRDRAAADNATMQEWARQLAMMNWQAQQEAAKYNVDAKNSYTTSTTQPILDLLLAMQQAGLPIPNLQGVM